MLRQIANILFVALACCFAFWLVWSSLDFQECIKGYSQNENSPERLEKPVGRISVSVIRRYAETAGAEPVIGPSRGPVRPTRSTDLRRFVAEGGDPASGLRDLRDLVSAARRA